MSTYFAASTNDEASKVKDPFNVPHTRRSWQGRLPAGSQRAAECKLEASRSTRPPKTNR